MVVNKGPHLVILVALLQRIGIHASNGAVQLGQLRGLLGHHVILLLEQLAEAVHLTLLLLPQLLGTLMVKVLSHQGTVLRCDLLLQLLDLET